MNSNTPIFKGIKSYLLVVGLLLPLLAVAIFFTFFSQNPSRNNVINQNKSILGVSYLSEPDTFFNYPFGEIIVAYRSGFNITIKNYSSMGVEEYSPESWNSINPEELASELGAQRVVVNSPKYWVVDNIEGLDVTQEDTVLDLSGVNVQEVVEIDAGSFGGDFNNSPYSKNNIGVNAKYTWNEGTQVYELTTPQGETFRMNAYSQSIDDTLTLNELAKLDERLDLPSGWQFKVNILESQYVFDDSRTNVIVDELGNTYIQII